MKKLIILSGPQGSGNHLFSKCFATVDQIGGWKELLSTYWQGHHKEPFNEVWQRNRDLLLSDFDGYDYWVTSVSVPFAKNGVLELPHVFDFYNSAVALGIDVQIGLISRDKNILELQQTRVREKPTLGQFINYFYDQNIPLHYISHETLILHGAKYMNYVCNLFGFPQIHTNKVNAIVEGSNSNKKYIRNVEEYWLDNEVNKAVSESKHGI
jgi:hypothetical protein